MKFCLYTAQMFIHLSYSCPFDRVTIYDGPDNLSEKIGTYCGQMRNLVIYSTKELGTAT